MDLQTAAAGALPALAAMWYVDTHDAQRPEPRALLRKVAVAGGLVTLPCIGAQFLLEAVSPLEGLAQALFTSYVMAGAVEELAKAACLLWVVWRRPEFDERFDGIVYGARAGLGFALVENVGYLWNTESPVGFAGVFLARAVLAVPGHAIWGGITGYFAARRKFDGRGIGLGGGLLLAILMHGSYNAALFALPFVPEGAWALTLGLLGIPLLVVFGGFWALRQMGRAALRADAADPRHAPLPPGVLQAHPVSGVFVLPPVLSAPGPQSAPAPSPR